MSLDRNDDWEMWDCECGNVIVCGVRDEQMRCHDCGQMYYKRPDTNGEMQLRQFVPYDLETGRPRGESICSVCVNNVSGWCVDRQAKTPIAYQLCSEFERRTR